jgi:hypothetical protein
LCRCYYLTAFFRESCLGPQLFREDTPEG